MVEPKGDATIMITAVRRELSDEGYKFEYMKFRDKNWCAAGGMFLKDVPFTSDKWQPLQLTASLK